MSNKDKSFITAVFKVNDKNNIKYIIFVGIDSYNIGINNLDIKIIIEFYF